MAISYAIARAALRHFFRNTAYTPDATIYVALWNGDPGRDGLGGTEVAGNAYARQPITFADVASTGDPGPLLNNLVTYAVATNSGWGLITHYAYYNALSGGTQIGAGQLTAQKTVGGGDTFRFPSGNLSVTFV